MWDLNDLLDKLEEIRDSFESEGKACPKIMVAQQPSWPLAATVEEATLIGDTLWIATREDGNYAPSAAWKGGEFASEEEAEGEEDED